MHKGYNVSVPGNYFRQFYDDGLDAHEDQKAIVESAIATFTNADGDLDASKLTARWFPPVTAQVFISHAHKDAKQAIGLAGFLQSDFGITSFIDSCVWGYADDLLKILDDEFCWQPANDTYNYRMRNKSTSHVHMMLSTALSKMMNQCECIMFLNTPSAISSADYIQGQVTDSPWIYAEIAMSSLLRERDASEHRRMAKSTHRLDEALNVQYEVDLDHLTKLTDNHFVQWRDLAKGKAAAEALDALYKMY